MKTRYANNHWEIVSRLQQQSDFHIFFFYSWYCCLSSRLTSVIVLPCTLCSFVQINGTINENIYFVRSPSPSCPSCRKRTPPLLRWRWRSLSTNMWSAPRETPCRRFWIKLASQLRSHLLTAAQKLSSFVESPTVWVRLSLKFMPRYITLWRLVMLRVLSTYEHWGVTTAFFLLQANSYTVSSVSAPSWLHRFIIGKKGQNLAKITQQMPKVC